MDFEESEIETSKIESRGESIREILKRNAPTLNRVYLNPETTKQPPISSQYGSWHY